MDTTVILRIRSQDVAHSWWIPKLGGKFDAIPGYTNKTWFKIPGDKAGTIFRGQCAELCGNGHANMFARVRAVTPAQFKAYQACQKLLIAQAQRATTPANRNRPAPPATRRVRRRAVVRKPERSDGHHDRNPHPPPARRSPRTTSSARAAAGSTG